MKISSTAFQQGEDIPEKYTCDGENKSPPLKIEEVPVNAVSLVLIMEDRDVPKEIRFDGLWNHWVVFNVPPGTNEILEGQNPFGRIGKNTRGALSYTRPCPPDRKHRYFFKLFALDRELELAEGAARTEVEAAMEGHVVETCVLMGVYERKK